jgi:hypothetical protein
VESVRSEKASTLAPRFDSKGEAKPTYLYNLPDLGEAQEPKPEKMAYREEALGRGAGRGLG